MVTKRPQSGFLTTISLVVTLAFDLKNLISSSLSQSAPTLEIWQNSPKWFMKYHVDKGACMDELDNPIIPNGWGIKLT